MKDYFIIGSNYEKIYVRRPAYHVSVVLVTFLIVLAFVQYYHLDISKFLR